MEERRPDLEFDLQLKSHERRLEALRSFRRATDEQLCHCEGEVAPAKRPGGSRDLASLLYERDAIDREIRGHEALIALGRDGRARGALHDVVRSLPLAREAARDPGSFAKSRGIDLPRNMVVRVEVVGRYVQVQAVYSDQTFSTVLTWTSPAPCEPG